MMVGEYFSKATAGDVVYALVQNGDMIQCDVCRGESTISIKNKTYDCPECETAEIIRYESDNNDYFVSEETIVEVSMRHLSKSVPEWTYITNVQESNGKTIFIDPVGMDASIDSLMKWLEKNKTGIDQIKFTKKITAEAMASKLNNNYE